jgi:hypothetical protein
LFGSGVRAAGAIAGRDADVILHSFISDDWTKNLELIASALGFSLRRSPVATTPEFHYRHSLAPPMFHGSRSSIESLNVQSELTLCYGMMQGNAIVSAESVVYDPQSPLRPQHFRQNGSDCRRLAIVANEAEIRGLSGCDDVKLGAETLCGDQAADVVVVKRGIRGCIVFSASGIHEFPAYRIRSSFLIGSGDIFSAEFAYRWLIEDESADRAAELASLAVAYYSQGPALPVPKLIPEGCHSGAIATPEKPRSIYLAGPFFNLQQLWMVEEALAHLTDQGLEVFSPFHRIGIGEPNVVAKQDVEAIRAADGMFALLDGYDAGTLFEIGLARSLDKPVTVFVTSRERQNLTMLTGTGCEVFHDFVSAVLWEASR